jgi:hypothetical protein
MSRKRQRIWKSDTNFRIEYILKTNYVSKNKEVSDLGSFSPGGRRLG